MGRARLWGADCMPFHEQKKELLALLTNSENSDTSHRVERG